MTPVLARLLHWGDGLPGRERLGWLASGLALIPVLMGLWLGTSLHALFQWGMSSQVNALDGWAMVAGGAAVWLCHSTMTLARRALTGLGGVLMLSGVWSIFQAMGTPDVVVGTYVGALQVCAGVWALSMGLHRGRWVAQWWVLGFLAQAWLFAFVGLELGAPEERPLLAPHLDTLQPWNLACLAWGSSMVVTLMGQGRMWELYARRADLRLVMFISVVLMCVVVTCVAGALLLAGWWSGMHMREYAVFGVASGHSWSLNPDVVEWVLFGLVLVTILLGRLTSRALLAVVQPLMTRMKEQERVFHDQPIGLVTLDKQGRVQSFNQRAQSMWRTTSLDEYRQPFWHLFSDQLLATRVVGVLETDVSSGTVLTKARRRDGSEMPVAVTFTRLTHPTDTICWVLSVEDDTVRSTERNRLRIYEDVFKHACVGIAIGSSDGATIAEVNEAFAYMHGGDVPDFNQKPLSEVFALDERKHLRAHTERVHRQGEYAFDSRHIRLDGTEFPVRVHAKVMHQAESESPYRVAYVQDLSAQHGLRQRLQDAESMAKLVLEAQQELVVRWLPDTTITFANRRYADLVNETETTICGKQWLEIRAGFGTTGSFRAVLQAHVLDLVTSPRILNFEDRFDSPNGPCWVYWSTVPVFGAEGGLREFQSIGHDITARKAAEGALATRDGWFRSVLESRRSFTVILDTSGIIQVISLSAAALFQRSQKDLVGHIYCELELFSGQPRVQCALREGVRAVESGSSHQAALTLTDAKGVERVFEMEFRPIFGTSYSDKSYVLVECHEVTAFHQYQRELAEQDVRFKVITDSMPGAVFEFCLEGEAVWLTYANHAYSQMFAPLNQNPQGAANLMDALHPNGRVGFLARLEQSHRDQTELRWEGQLSRNDGLWLSIRAMPQQVKGRTIWRGFGLDISDAKHREQEIERSRSELRALSVHHEKLRDDERRRMAREVHDELGQSLTALRMGLSVLGVSQGDIGQVGEEAARLKGLVDNSIKVVRGIATTLRPAAMDMGLGAALSWLASEFERNTHLRCALDFDVGEITFDETTATALFRITQESLTNVARHAYASQVWIRGRQINRHFVLEIVDDGQGFDADASDKLHGFGLRGMKERVLSLDGDFIISSNHGGGTVVSIHMPVKGGAR